MAKMPELDIFDQWPHDLIDVVVFSFVSGCFAVLVAQLLPVIETIDGGTEGMWYIRLRDVFCGQNRGCMSFKMC